MPTSNGIISSYKRGKNINTSAYLFGDQPTGYYVLKVVKILCFQNVDKNNIHCKVKR